MVQEVQKKPLRELGNHPDDEQPINIYDGPYGVYFKHGKTNVKLPEGETTESMSLDKALLLLKDKAPAKKKTTTRKKATTKKTTTKKTTTRKKKNRRQLNLYFFHSKRGLNPLSLIDNQKRTKNMIQQLKQVFPQLSELSEDEQEKIAQVIMTTIEKQQNAKKNH